MKLVILKKNFKKTQTDIDTEKKKKYSDTDDEGIKYTLSVLTYEEVALRTKQLLKGI